MFKRRKIQGAALSNVLEGTRRQSRETCDYLHRVSQASAMGSGSSCLTGIWETRAVATPAQGQQVRQTARALLPSWVRWVLNGD